MKASRSSLIAAGTLAFALIPKGTLADGKTTADRIREYYKHGGWVADPAAEAAKLAGSSNPTRVAQWHAGPAEEAARALELGRKAAATRDIGEDLVGILAKARSSAEAFASTGVPEARNVSYELGSLERDLTQLVDAARLTGDLAPMSPGESKNPPHAIHVEAEKVLKAVRDAVNEGNTALSRGACAAALLRRLELASRVANRFGASKAITDDLATVLKEVRESRSVAQIVHGNPDATVTVAEVRAKVKGGSKLSRALTAATGVDAEGMADHWQKFADRARQLHDLPAREAAALVEAQSKVDAVSLQTLVECELALGDLAKARDATELAAEAWELFLRDFKAFSPDASTYQGFVQGLIGIENAALTVAAKLPTDSSAARLAFWVVSSGRDRAFDDSGRAVSDSAQKTTAGLEAVRALRARRAAGYLAALPGPVPAFAEAGRLQELEVGLFQGAAIKGLALSSMSGTTQPFQEYDRKALLRGSKETFIGAVVQALGAGEALVEYARYTPSILGGKRAAMGAPRYAALVLTKAATPVVVDLGLADEIDVLSERLRTLLRDPRSAVPAVKAASQSLRQRIWAPIEALFAHPSHVYVAADGALQLVPFESLHDGSSWLVDRQSISYVNAPRDLIALTAARAKSTTPPVILASPVPPAKTYASVALDPRWYPSLAGAALEAKAVAARLRGAVTLTGPAVDEPTLLSLKAPRVLHIAAHGLFLDEGDGGPANTRGLIRVSTSLPPAYEAKARAITDDAWIRAMLVLSPPQTSSSTSPWDSFATAYELARMDLKGTALAVLSACDAGVGIYGGGQGVRSMRRALAMAGAESVVASLWMVEDTGTATFMDIFYRGLAAAASRAQALRDAKLELKRNPRYAHPFYWASFIMSGATAPL